jgi:hypothetical protein
MGMNGRTAWRARRLGGPNLLIAGGSLSARERASSRITPSNVVRCCLPRPVACSLTALTVWLNCALFPRWGLSPPFYQWRRGAGVLFVTMLGLSDLSARLGCFVDCDSLIFQLLSSLISVPPSSVSSVPLSPRSRSLPRGTSLISVLV